MWSYIVLFVLLTFVSQSENQILEINDGKLEGTVLQTRKGTNIFAFLRIPYAEPPVESLRFQPPVPNKKWTGTLNATKYGPMCMQPYYDSIYGMSENCLHLNVFTKSLSSIDPKPVILFIHGGGFENGTASSHGPEYLMDRDVVLVTINYRLGPFGFLALGTKEVVGNMGLKDQALALKWVQKNIKNFGGDPNSVTIAGLSAGAMSATAHMVSDLSKGLFHQVIAMSGAITWQKGFKTHNKPMAIELAEKLKCSSELDDMLECLNQKSATEISLAGMKHFHACPIMQWTPVVEPDYGQEKFFTDDPNKLFKTGNFSKVPVLIGITADEFIEPVNTLLSNKASLKQLNENFTSFAPECFFFAGKNSKATKKLAKKLKNYYLPFDKIDKRSFNSLRLLLADGTIGYNVHRFTHLVSSLVDVFYYKFSYMGRFSTFHFPRERNFGVHHVDDIQYLFGSSFIGPLIKTIDPENFMVERMTSIWEQFAKFGNPNNQTNEYLADMIWPKHDLVDEYFLDIGNDMVEKQGLYLERYFFWDGLINSSSYHFGAETVLALLIQTLILFYFR